MKEQTSSTEKVDIGFDDFRTEVLNDFRIANESRQASLLGRKEVLTGKAKFGIFGDGKEIAQIAMAKQFKAGDFRAGYYRDQTFMFAIGESDVEKFFAQLYANPDIEAEPSSGGRSMNGHFSTRLLNDDGTWKELSQLKNSSSDISPTAGQMPRLVGLAWASKLYRNNTELHDLKQFSNLGNEVAFGTIGDASTSEGVFYEAINAAGVLQIPMAISVWDDGYGISVPAKYQTTKQNISEILKGFEQNEKGKGFLILRARGWDYPGLCEMYSKGIQSCREEHIPVLFHVREMTQPQGHSTSGSHERYKSEERLKWESENDCIQRMKEWIISSALATSEECEQIESEAKAYVRQAQKKAWAAFMNPIIAEIRELNTILENLALVSQNKDEILNTVNELKSIIDPARRDLASAAHKILFNTRFEESPQREALLRWDKVNRAKNTERYNSKLHSDNSGSPLFVESVEVQYAADAALVDGREILQANFDKLFSKDPRLVAFGEDLGKIGDVNQGFAGLQSKYGELRITDTGIREATIAGQGIGLALRGLRPIAEIQYLDYVLYAIQILSDDLATLAYRTKGGQKAPLIIRTRGHRLEGIWHSGSPLGMIINALRGIHILVPRDMTRAAGFYNTLLAGDEPGMIIECLNGYRLKERLPNNLGEFKTPLGQPEVLIEGTDVTLVTYGSCVRIAEEAVKELNKVNISVELIDIQSLLPFDIHSSILESVKKTNKLMVLDEDVPGGASAYILQQILETQNAFQHLDSLPITLTAHAHRAAYGSDGDYFSKPNTEDVIDSVYMMMHEYNPDKFPKFK
ncbi:MAG TPA: thiamine pyrophosphate-dependent enzyme [Bacteroidia bacterium]|nr:thiamine pyrophosphate-dependent enzyme [Bacteroidia bacterium]